jgi:D-alanyl-D-alanine carboxypeptidase (penicillin-binding protein 5/6)
VQTIVQPNRNTLLDSYPGADGLKTGFIDESGYNLAATAVCGEQRLVAVVLGIQAKDEPTGSRLRTLAGSRLLDYGFATFPLQPLPLPDVKPVRVWFAAPGSIIPAPAGPTVYPLAKGELGGINVRIDSPYEVEGPIAPGTIVGRIVWSKGGEDFYEVDLKTVTNTGKAPWWVSLWDHVVLFFRGLIGVAPPKPASLHR